MRRALVLLALLLAVPFAASAEDPRVWIASGVSGGSYRGVYARHLEARLSEYTVIHRLSSGSGENLEMLADGRADFAFAQADVFAARVRADPERYASFGALGRLGTECVYVAVRKQGAVHALRDFAAPAHGRSAEIAVGPPQGGPSGTWTHLVSLSPELASAIAHPVGDRVALRFLERGTFDAVLWVTDPTNFDHRMLRAVRESAQLELMEVSEEAFTSTALEGVQIYEAGGVRLARGGPEIRTICTSAILFSRGDTDPSLVARARGMRGLRPIRDESR